MAELRPTTAVGSSVLATEKIVDSCLLAKRQALYPCATFDALITNLVSDRLLKTFSPVAVYGSVGFVSLSTCVVNAATRPLWKQCNNLSYCDGPIYEGFVNELFSRYQTRWLFRFDSGLLSYGIVGENLVRLITMFPSAVEYDTFSSCFDQNARPVVVFCVGTTIELRKIQADVVTSFVFTGESPVLFQNALLQADTTQQDVVCYYLRAGHLCGRWQRDNFEVEYILVNNVAVDSLFSVRASNLLTSPREFLFCQSGCSTLLLTSALYPPWPVLVLDQITASVAVSFDGDYFPMIVNTEELDTLTALVALLTDGDYQSVNVDKISSDAVTGTASLNIDGDYIAVAVSVPNTVDALSGTVAILFDGNYYLSIITGSSYVDIATATAALLTDGDYTL